MKTLKTIIFLAWLAFGVVCGAEPAAEAEGEHRILKTITLGGEGGWDYLTLDSAGRRLYIGRNDRVMVFDVDAEKLAGEIQNMQGVHGVALAPEFNRGFVSSGKDNTVRVFDLASLKETSQIKVGPKPDAIIYDPASKKIFSCNNGGTTVTVIDAAAGTVAAEIELNGAPEFAVADGKGTVFVNLEDKSEVAAIDSKELKVLQHWPLAPGKGPTGLSLDVKARRLFSGCRSSQTLEVMDAGNGKIIASLPIGAGVDATAFDAAAANAFSSNGDGTLTVIHEDSSGAFRVIQNAVTQPGARTMALDEKTHRIWLAVAEVKAGPADEHGKARRVVVPGTFRLLVVGKN
jgi:DNA-binding beta-propeller fold protein YncE